MWGLLGTENNDSQKVNCDGLSSTYLDFSEQFFNMQRSVYFSGLCKGARMKESLLNMCHLTMQKLKDEK